MTDVDDDRCEVGEGHVTDADDHLGPYEAVTAHPEGETTVARYAQTAADSEFAGVVVRTWEASVDAAAVREQTGVDVVSAVEVDADDPASASGAVGNARPKCDVVIVRGGTSTLNRFAVEQDRVDVVAAPLQGDGDVDHVFAKTAREHRTYVEVNLGPVLRAAGGERVQHLQSLRKLRELLDYYDTPHVVSARPSSHLEVRAPRELVAVGETVGFEPETVRAGLRAWGEIARENRRRRSDSFIAPGVQRVTREEDTG